MPRVDGIWSAVMVKKNVEADCEDLDGCEGGAALVMSSVRGHMNLDYDESWRLVQRRMYAFIRH